MNRFKIKPQTNIKEDMEMMKELIIEKIISNFNNRRSTTTTDIINLCDGNLEALYNLILNSRVWIINTPMKMSNVDEQHVILCHPINSVILTDLEMNRIGDSKEYAPKLEVIRRECNRLVIPSSNTGSTVTIRTDIYELLEKSYGISRFESHLGFCILESNNEIKIFEAGHGIYPLMMVY